MSYHNYSRSGERDYNPAPDFTRRSYSYHKAPETRLPGLRSLALEPQDYPEDLRLPEPHHPDSYYHQTPDSTPYPDSHNLSSGSGYNYEQALHYMQGRHVDQNYCSMRGPSLGHHQHATHHHDDHTGRTRHPSHANHERSDYHQSRHASRVSPYMSSSGGHRRLAHQPLSSRNEIIQSNFESSNARRSGDLENTGSKMPIGRETLRIEAARPVKPKKLKLTEDIEEYYRLERKLDRANVEADTLYREDKSHARKIEKLENDLSKLRASIRLGREKEEKQGFERKEDVSGIWKSRR